MQQFIPPAAKPKRLACSRAKPGGKTQFPAFRCHSAPSRNRHYIHSTKTLAKFGDNEFTSWLVGAVMQAQGWQTKIDCRSDAGMVTSAKALIGR